MLTFHAIQCPYCGESIDIALDGSVDHQRYIEDCQVCCRPIVLTVSVDADAQVQVSARAENET
ncbi:CPXCG motif-containing cysteine-rich protein [Chiayiivirga flava]|uniref:Transposase-like protein n=1 Tax=Chiayiivirga flava TaxID=659595 RepID=A0A7W8D7W7_9GAMM|nr:transposase-like protein [Chiayiivirga flava]